MNIIGFDREIFLAPSKRRIGFGNACEAPLVVCESLRQRPEAEWIGRVANQFTVAPPQRCSDDSTCSECREMVPHVRKNLSHMSQNSIVLKSGSIAQPLREVLGAGCVEDVWIVERGDKGSIDCNRCTCVEVCEVGAHSVRHNHPGGDVRANTILKGPSLGDGVDALLEVAIVAKRGAKYSSHPPQELHYSILCYCRCAILGLAVFVNNNWRLQAGKSTVPPGQM